MSTEFRSRTDKIAFRAALVEESGRVLTRSFPERFLRGAFVREVRASGGSSGGVGNGEVTRRSSAAQPKTPPFMYSVGSALIRKNPSHPSVVTGGKCLIVFSEGRSNGRSRQIKYRQHHSPSARR